MAGDLKLDLNGIGQLVSGIGDAARGVREAITGKAILDPAKQAEIELKAMELETKGRELDNALILMQGEINKIEAASTSKFVSGWRPFIGWVSGVSLGVYFVPRFVLGMTFWTIACIKAGALIPMPDMGVTDLLGLLGSMLGFGILRTVEKGKGVARN